MSLIRQNFHDESEAAINKQINMELHASYVYLAIAYQFDRHDVALEGTFKYFKDNSDEEHEHAQKLMRYLNERGGTITLEPIQPPSKFDYKTTIEAMNEALKLELKVNESLLNIHQIASKHNDAHLSDFLEGEFLDEQVKSIRQLGSHITNLKCIGSGLGEYQFDKLTLNKVSDSS